MSDVVLTPVREAHRFDQHALAEYLSRTVPEFSHGIHVEQFEGGQSNPTFRITAGGRRYVLRKQPPGELLPSAHQVDREFRVQQDYKVLPRDEVINFRKQYFGPQADKFIFMNLNRNQIRKDIPRRFVLS